MSSRTIEDLMFGLTRAEQLKLVERVDVQSNYLDIDFDQTTTDIEAILDLRLFIQENYSFVQSVDYMPIVCRLRLYGQF